MSVAIQLSIKNGSIHAGWTSSGAHCLAGDLWQRYGRQWFWITFAHSSRILKDPRYSTAASLGSCKNELIGSFFCWEPICRRPADSLGPAGVTIRADADGFDDLDDFFSQEFENKPKVDEENKVAVDTLGKIEEATEADYIVSQPVRNSIGHSGNKPWFINFRFEALRLEYTIPLKGDSDVEMEDATVEDAAEDGYPADSIPMDDDYGCMPAEVTNSNGFNSDDEIGFSPNITVRPHVNISPSAVAVETPVQTVVTKKKAAVVKAKKEAKPSKPRTVPAVRKETTTVKTGGDLYLSDEFKRQESGRQSRRNRIAPLEFWRGEAVQYKVDPELSKIELSFFINLTFIIEIPVVVGVVRRTKSPQKPKSRTAARKSASKNTARSKAVENNLEAAGYVKDVEVISKVMDYDTHVEEERLLAISLDQHELRPVKDEQFLISTAFEESDFLSAGILSFPPGVKKPSRNSANYALVFYVINGSFQVNIGSSQFVIGTGGQFIVPRGNHYQLKNLHDQESKLHFCHCMDGRS